MSLLRSLLLTSAAAAALICRLAAKEIRCPFLQDHPYTSKDNDYCLRQGSEGRTSHCYCDPEQHTVTRCEWRRETDKGEGEEWSLEIACLPLEYTAVHPRVFLQMTDLDGMVKVYSTGIKSIPFPNSTMHFPNLDQFHFVDNLDLADLGKLKKAKFGASFKGAAFVRSSLTQYPLLDVDPKARFMAAFIESRVKTFPTGYFDSFVDQLTQLVIGPHKEMTALPANMLKFQQQGGERTLDVFIDKSFRSLGKNCLGSAEFRKFNNRPFDYENWHSGECKSMEFVDQCVACQLQNHKMSFRLAHQSCPHNDHADDVDTDTPNLIFIESARSASLLAMYSPTCVLFVIWLVSSL